MHHQRRRILAGAASIIAQRGYRQVSVADIVKTAAIARARFYENFGSKQDCFFVLYDDAASAALEVVSKACEGAEDPFPERVRLSIEALLAHLAADPNLTRAFIVEGPAVGAPINQRFESLITGFAELLRAGRPAATEIELPETVEETVIGGLYWLLYDAILEGRPKRIQELAPQLTEFSLIPFLGIDAARAANPS